MHDARIGGFRRPWSFWLLGSLALSAAGCTDDHAGVGDPDAARTFVVQLTRVSAGMTAMSGADVAAGLQAMLAAGQFVVGPGDGKTTVGLVELTSAPFAGAGVCTAGVCDLMGYRAGSFLEDNFLMEGAITRTNDVSTFLLSYNEYRKGAMAHWNLDGRLVTTGSQVDGVFNGHGMTTDDIAWDFTIQVEAAVLDAQGCPTSGALVGDVRYLDQALPPSDDPSRSPSYERTGTVELGAGCGAAP